MKAGAIPPGDKTYAHVSRRRALRARCDQDLRRPARPRRRVAGCQPRRDDRPDWPVGFGQVDPATLHNRPGRQQQRAAIARALVQKAKIILADEPVASLDPVSARRVMEILCDLNREDGLTVIVTLHQVDYALRYCKRVVALKGGKVVYDGP